MALFLSDLRAQECSFVAQSKLKSAQACLEAFELAPRGPKAESCDGKTEDRECEDRYHRLTKDGMINVTIARGYNNVTDESSSDNGAVMNDYYNAQLISKLTSPCPGEYSNFFSPRDADSECERGISLKQSCGFSQGDDPEIFTKSVVLRGEVHQVRVRLVSAALTASDAENRKSEDLFIEERFCMGEKNVAACLKAHRPPKVPVAELEKKCSQEDVHKFQICKTAYVQGVWENSIANGDEVVMYQGHARAGGGPSFEPPKMLKGHVDYQWYQQQRPGHKREIEAFQKAVKNGRAPVFYTSASCKSGPLFMKEGSFPEVSPATSYVMSSDLAYTWEGVAVALGTLEGVLGGKCRDELNETIETATCNYQINNF